MALVEAPTDSTQGYSIAEVAARVGVSAHTLRYYERIGLLSIERNGSGRRVYRDGDLSRIVFIARLRSTHLPIADLRRYFELVDEGPHTEADRLAILVNHRDNVLAQLAEVQSALAAIEFKIDLYGGGLTGCTTG